MWRELGNDGSWFPIHILVKFREISVLSNNDSKTPTVDTWSTSECHFSPPLIIDNQISEFFPRNYFKSNFHYSNTMSNTGMAYTWIFSNTSSFSKESYHESDSWYYLCASFYCVMTCHVVSRNAVYHASNSLQDAPSYFELNSHLAWLMYVSCCVTICLSIAPLIFSS